LEIMSSIAERLRRWCSRGKPPEEPEPGPGIYSSVFIGRSVTLKDGTWLPLMGMWIKVWWN